MDKAPTKWLTLKFRYIDLFKGEAEEVHYEKLNTKYIKKIDYNATGSKAEIQVEGEKPYKFNLDKEGWKYLNEFLKDPTKISDTLIIDFIKSS